MVTSFIVLNVHFTMNEDAQDEYLSFIVLVFIIYLLKRLLWMLRKPALIELKLTFSRLLLFTPDLWFWNLVLNHHLQEVGPALDRHKEINVLTVSCASEGCRSSLSLTQSLNAQGKKHFINPEGEIVIRPHGAATCWESAWGPEEAEVPLKGFFFLFNKHTVKY